MSPELQSEVRRGAIEDLGQIIDSEFGMLTCGAGRFEGTDFNRDLYTSTILSLSKDQGPLTAQIIAAARIGQRVSVVNEGKAFNPDTEEAPGKKFHELHTSRSPQWRLAELRDHGWCVQEGPDGRLSMIYYGAGDTTALHNISVGVVANAVLRQDGPDAERAYLQEMYPSVVSGLTHDIEIADIDGDGLIESSPQNTKCLLNHVWKDSNSAYVDEKGNLPKPPYKYFSNNAYHLWSLRESSRIASKLGYFDVAEDLMDRYQKARHALHNRFWVARKGLFAPVIDGDGKRVVFSADDVVDGLWAKVIYPEFAPTVIANLRKPDMLTDWGLRTRSSSSSQFAENGSNAYHNGLVWLHRNRIAAEGADNYGYSEFAEVLDSRSARLEKAVGRVECVSVARDNTTLISYMENGVEVACKPQAWAVNGNLARTAPRTSGGYYVHEFALKPAA